MNGGLHSRRLSATADINYGELAPGSTSAHTLASPGIQKKDYNIDKPLPPIKQEQTRPILKKKHRVRFEGTDDENDDFEDFNIDDEDYETENKRVDQDQSMNSGSTQSYIQFILHPSHDTLNILGCILGWYVFSLAISLYNKWMFDKSNLNFPYPIISTSFHQFVLFWLSFALIYFVPKLRPPTAQQIQLGQVKNPIIDNIDGSDTSAGLKRAFRFADYMMDKRVYLVSILPCAIATSGDIGCGNVSFRFITLSLYTMIKSSSVAFVLVFGVLFKLEKLTFKLACIVGIMTFGVMMMVGGSGNERGHDSVEEQERKRADLLFGSFLVLVASCMSGLRWALTQLVLKQNEHVNSPVATIYYLSPPMFLILFVIGAFVENIHSFFTNDIWTDKGIFKTVLILIMPGLLVFCMTLFELRLLQKSHVVTLSIAGIFKELLTIIVSTFIFGDKLTIINSFGLIITLSDIIWYNYYRFSEDKQDVGYQKVGDEVNASELGIELRNVRD